MKIKARKDANLRNSGNEKKEKPYAYAPKIGAVCGI
jgi:hypothetical protein